MTYEEAIKNINALNAVCGQKGLYDAEFESALSLAILALEKQIPKKPYKDNENGVYEKEHCPSCHRSLFPNDHHCECGQAIVRVPAPLQSYL